MRIRAAVVVAVTLGAVCASAPTSAVAAPTCNKTAAKRAVTASTMAPRMRKALGSRYFGGQKVMEVFFVSSVSCRDLTGDGRGEMTVLLGCCTVGAPDPWGIFVAKDGRWRLSFSRIRTSVFGLETGSFEDPEGGASRLAVEEKSPVYAESDPNCCPSSYRYRYTAWNGARFVFGVS